MTPRTVPFLRPAGPADREFLAASLQLYQSEIAAFGVDVPLDRALEGAWFEHPGLHPFVIERAGRSVGFALVMGEEYTRACGGDTQFSVYDYWVVPEERGSGIAREAVRELLGLLPGSWSVSVWPRNERALGFWRGVLAEELAGAGDACVGEEGLVVLRFVTSGGVGE